MKLRKHAKIVTLRNPLSIRRGRSAANILKYARMAARSELRNLESSLAGMNEGRLTEAEGVAIQIVKKSLEIIVVAANSDLDAISADQTSDMSQKRLGSFNPQ